MKYYLRWWAIAALSAVFLLSFGPVLAGEARIAIGGYDTVAYFTDSKAVPGKGEYQYTWHDTQWLFSSAAHRDLFVSNPDRYAPQYDGYCAMGVSIENNAHKDTVDPQAWAILDGKLYLAHDRHWIEVFRERAAENIARADANWPKVKGQEITYDGFPNVQK